MKKNVGGTDGLIRAILGIILGTLYFIGVVNDTTGIILFLAGGVLLFTSMEGFCPLYAMFGINTRHHRHAGKVAAGGRNLAA
jgi:hypothetical protein